MRECVLNLATITDIPRVVVQGRTGEQRLLKPAIVSFAYLSNAKSLPADARFMRPLTPCSGLSPLGRRPLVALVYPTPEQAAATLIAVHCCTWSVKENASCNVRIFVAILSQFRLAR